MGICALPMRKWWPSPIPIPWRGRNFARNLAFPTRTPRWTKWWREKTSISPAFCTWHLLHPDCTIGAANGGVPGIICEKPMAIGLGEADRMLEACEQNGAKLVISHQRRFTPGWERARALMRDKVIGDAVMVQGQVAQGLINWGDAYHRWHSLCVGRSQNRVGDGRGRAARPTGLSAIRQSRMRAWGLIAFEKWRAGFDPSGSESTRGKTRGIFRSAAQRA